MISSIVTESVCSCLAAWWRPALPSQLHQSLMFPHKEPGIRPHPTHTGSPALLHARLRVDHDSVTARKFLSPVALILCFLSCWTSFPPVVLSNWIADLDSALLREGTLQEEGGSVCCAVLHSWRPLFPKRIRGKVCSLLLEKRKERLKLKVEKEEVSDVSKKKCRWKSMRRSFVFLQVQREMDWIWT